VGVVAPKERNIGYVVGGVCDRHGRKVPTGSRFENFKKGDHLENLNLILTMILK
jgi:hypothetical protein